MNDACPSQRYKSAYPRSELFERRRRRMDDRAAVAAGERHVKARLAPNPYQSPE